MLSIVLIGVSLAMDAFAISVTCGLSSRGFRLRHALVLGLYFGFFQFLMPLVGSLLASTVSDQVSRFGPYISFLRLAGIGGRMVWGAVRGQEEAPAAGGAVDLRPARMVALAVATSIDALAVGVSFAFMEGISLVPACLVIGAVTFAICVLGGLFGSRIPGLKGKSAEILGGCVLLGIGVKLLLEGIL